MSADEHLSDQFSYRGRHQPPPDGPPLHDLHAGGSFPEDVYDTLHHYTHTGGAEPYDRESVAAVKAVRGRPDARVTVYRAAPHGVTSINPGDWVSLSPSYARQHARHADDPSQDWPVHSATVPASHVRNGGNDIVEWGYHGPAPVSVRTKKPPKRGWSD